MAVNNTFTITYAGQAVGGSSDVYQLHGPYVIDKSFTSLRLVFDVVCVGTSYANLQSISDTLETAFSKRDQTLSISLDGSTWTYTHGTDILNTTASIAKTGNPESDQGYSRAYTCVVEAELPADDQDGLQSLEVNVDYEPGRRKIATFRGTYTATGGTAAATQYASDFDSEASTILTAIDSGATWELAQEEYTRDRNDHRCDFSRQYVELLANQTASNLDDTKIRDHRIFFTEQYNQPGDSKEDIYRLRRVECSYDCSIDIDVGTNLYSVFDDDVRPHVISLFETNFTPQVFAIEDRRVTYDETSKRLSASIRILYQTTSSEPIVEVTQQLAYRETRVIDYTPVHDGQEFAAYADPGWAILERIATRTVIVVGDETPKRRLGRKPETGSAGDIEGIAGGPTVVTEGWNIIQNTSQVNKQFVGDPDEDETIELTILNETVVERFNQRPTNDRQTRVPRVRFEQ